MADYVEDLLSANFTGTRDKLGPTHPLNTPTGGLTASQSRAILIVALTSGCVSLVAALVALRWFILMRRCFRHVLVMFLIMSETIKSMCYSIFPIVVFARGPVPDASAWCQASGFFLAFSIEASDVAILLVALHAILHITRPTNAGEEGGLHRYRNWIYPILFGFPLLAASLAFVNPTNGYVNSGTFCYLPKRPYWYRLALSWVPRYLIIAVILGMYIWVYVYVYLKFRSFNTLSHIDSSCDSEATSQRKSSANSGYFREVDFNVSPASQQQQQQQHPPLPSPRLMLSPQQRLNGSFRATKPVSAKGPKDEPWEGVDFVTATPLETVGESAAEGEALEVGQVYGQTGPIGPRSSATESSQSTKVGTSNPGSRHTSQAPTLNFNRVQIDPSDEGKPLEQVVKLTSSRNDPLQRTRTAIRRQLRYLFIYPVVYIAMWSFPFVSHALMYTDYYASHPVFWINVISVTLLGLQAGVYSVLFSWREKPWRRIESNSKLSLSNLPWPGGSFLKQQPQAVRASSVVSNNGERAQSRKIHVNWWEAEGRRRNDSVWMGTSSFSDTMSPTRTRTFSRTFSLRPTSLDIGHQDVDKPMGNVDPDSPRRSTLVRTPSARGGRGHRPQLSTSSSRRTVSSDVQRVQNGPEQMTKGPFPGDNIEE